MDEYGLFQKSPHIYHGISLNMVHIYHGPYFTYRVVLYPQWEFQDPKMEVLYHIRPYFAGIFPYIGLKNRPKIYGRYLQFRFLKWPLILYPYVPMKSLDVLRRSTARCGWSFSGRLFEGPQLFGSQKQSG